MIIRVSNLLHAESIFYTFACNAFFAVQIYHFDFANYYRYSLRAPLAIIRGIRV